MLFRDAEARGLDREAVLRESAATTRSGRVTTPEEVAGLVAYLACEEAAQVNGAGHPDGRAAAPRVSLPQPPTDGIFTSNLIAASCSGAMPSFLSIGSHRGSLRTLSKNGSNATSLRPGSCSTRAVSRYLNARSDSLRQRVDVGDVVRPAIRDTS